MSLPTEADVRRWSELVRHALDKDAAYEVWIALGKLEMHARAGLEPRQKLGGRKKTGTASRTPQVIALAVDVFRELQAMGLVSVTPEGVDLPRGFVGKLHEKCLMQGMDISERAVQEVVKDQHFNYRLYMLVR